MYIWPAEADSQKANTAFYIAVKVGGRWQGNPKMTKRTCGSQAAPGGVAGVTGVQVVTTRSSCHRPHGQRTHSRTVWRQGHDYSRLC